MENRRVTIKDVARVAGVSTGTVSRFIRNKGYVGEESKKKVESAIDELQYIPNAAARNMVDGKSKIVGVAVPEINNPFLANLMIRMEESLSMRGYSVMLCNTGFNPHKVETFINDLIMRDAEGVILAATDIIFTDENILSKINKYMYGVSVGQKIPNFDCINFADYELAFQITEYLIKMGHRDIACIAFNENATQTMARKAGFMRAMEKYNIPIRKEMMIGFESILKYVIGENGGYICAQKLFENEKWPTAIVAANDFYAIGAYKAATEHGLTVGEDISVVGFDNIDMANFISPTLTTVDCDTHIMAELAADLLDRKIKGLYKKDETQEVILPASIIYRNSVNKNYEKI
ncbi:MAG: LacI family DNA-binding transcriptional regulator [Christensenella sp.]